MHIKAYGIIDPDYRNDENIRATQETVSILNVMEIESLYFVPELFNAVYKDANIEPDSDRKSLEESIKKKLGKQGTTNQHLTNIKKQKYTYLIEEHLVSKINCTDTLESIIKKISSTIQEHDRSDQYKKYNDNIDLFEKENSQGVANLTLEEIFQGIKIKSIYGKNGEIFKVLKDLGFAKESYIRTVCKVLSNDNDQELRKTIQEKYIFPIIPESHLTSCDQSSEFPKELQKERDRKMDKERRERRHDVDYF